jgi:hypothetical protein
VALLTPLTVGELDVAVGDLRATLVDPATVGQESKRALLRELHQVLVRAAAQPADPPIVSLQGVADLLAAVSVRLLDSMAPRPRTAFRLLRGGAMEAAWWVLIDSGIGVVTVPSDAATATGGTRAAARLPLLTRIEAPTVYADLPGFRDPRLGVADDFYDITDAIKLRHALDEIAVNPDSITFGGWAALDVLPTAADERVWLVATSDDYEVAVAGARVRRPDLVSGAGGGLLKRAWAGWSVRLDLAHPRLATGAWELSLELDHAGVVRRATLGADASDLARAATRATTRIASGSLRWQTDGQPWRLVIT